MSDYKHGAYAAEGGQQDYTTPTNVGTIPVYVACAPVHQLADSHGAVRAPLLINSWQDAIRKIGYSELWADFGLCEAVYAHFRNNVRAIGPIVVINALDPDEHRATEETTKALTFVKRTAVIDDPYVILNTFEIEGKVSGTDYRAAYSDDGQQLVVKDLTGTMTAGASAAYFRVEPSTVADADIVQCVQEVIPLVYYASSQIPTILCAPGWSHKPAVFTALVNSQAQINGHWYAWINADIESSTVKTIDSALAAKDAYADSSAACALLWPMAKKGTRKFHASVLNTVTMQWVDFDNGNVPYETPSNKRIDIDGLCLADGSVISFDQTQANELNAAGIDTVTYWEGTWRMWGPHTMLYSFGGSVASSDIFDCNVRMRHYVSNSFQRRYGDIVDKPMTRSRKDSILNDFQAWLDALIQSGALLAGSIIFNEADNPASDLVQGNFEFSTTFTNPVPGKSLNNTVRWVADGLTSLLGGGSDGQ